MTLSKITLCLVMAAIASGAAWANPAWQADGVGACVSAGAQEAPSVVSLGNDGAIIVWADRRGSSYDIYAQKLDPTGRPVWTPGGVLVCGADYDQQFPVITGDGAGGAIIAWQDGRLGDDGVDIYAQRVDPNGNMLWTANGVVLCGHAAGLLDPPVAYSLCSVSDGSGGAIVCWRDTRHDLITGSTEVYVQKVNGNGVAQWTANGVAVVSFGTSVPWKTRNPVMTADGAGGAIVVWQDARNSLSSANDLYGQRITPSGGMLWPANGVLICNASGDQGYPDICLAATGEAVVTWEDFRTGNWDIYAQRLNSSTGQGLWGANGAGICTSAGDQRTPRIVANGSGGVIVSWSDGRTTPSTPDVYAQMVNGSGTPQWSAGGVPVCTAAGWQGRIRMCSDTGGNTIIAWTDNRIDPTDVTHNYDIYAQRLNTSGAAQWTTNGVAVSTADLVQRLQQVTADGSGGAYVVWEDNRNAGDYDIYAQRLTAVPPIAVTGISDLKTRADGTLITLPALIVSRSFTDCFYIEEAGRYAGVRVIPQQPLTDGQTVVVSGTLETGSERVIRATSVKAVGSSLITPLGLSPSKLGSSNGLSNTGILVRTWGSVIGSGVIPRHYLIISDGNTAVRVYTPASYSNGTFVTATGISSCESGQPVILTRDASDVVSSP